MLVKASMSLHDNEDLSADKEATYSNLTGWIDLDQQNPKLELEFQGILNLQNPNLVELTVFALLFEGVSDSTTDLDGQFQSDHLVPRGQTVVISGMIFNSRRETG
jgi:hypothetical protein